LAEALQYLTTKDEGLILSVIVGVKVMQMQMALVIKLMRGCYWFVSIHFRESTGFNHVFHNATK